jgi:Flp pilus assembly protein TadG
MVEFALVAPLAFLLIIGIVVVGIVVLHQNQLANTSREIARAAAVCGSSPPDPSGNPTITKLPNGATCNDANLLSYARALLANIDSTNTWNPTFTVLNVSGVSCTVAGACAVSGSGLASCMGGYAFHVSVTYPQPLYVPLVSNLLGSGGVRTLNATGVASCEQ